MQIWKERLQGSSCSGGNSQKLAVGMLFVSLAHGTDRWLSRGSSASHVYLCFVSFFFNLRILVYIGNVSNAKLSIHTSFANSKFMLVPDFECQKYPKYVSIRVPLILSNSCQWLFSGCRLTHISSSPSKFSSATATDRIRSRSRVLVR